MYAKKISRKVGLFLVGLFLLISVFGVAWGTGPALTLSNSAIPVNGAVDVTLANAQSPTHLKDWVGIYENNITPSGNPPAIWWGYLLDLGVTDGNGTFIFDPANIPSAQKSRFAAGGTYKFILAYDDSYTVITGVSFNTTASQNPTIVSFDPVVLNTNAGIAPSLPATVMANYSNSTRGSVNVAWNSISPSQYAQAGSFTVKGLVSTTGVVPKASITVKEGSGPLFSFAVISDVHINGLTGVYPDHFRGALNDMNGTGQNLSALCIVGDFTNDGSATQYDYFNSIINSISHPTTYIAIGNHEIAYQPDYNTGKNNFLTKTGMPGIYYDQWINGYHFIFLGTENLVSHSFNLTDTQLQWFQQKLGENASSGKPIFVFIHQPLGDTAAGSETYKDVIQDQQLKNILALYPQSILFAGHTHYIETSYNQFYNQQYCHFANTASVAYLWYGPTNSQPGNGSQGLYVDVYPGKVVVKGREYTRQEWIPAAQETIVYSQGPTPTPRPTVTPSLTPTATPTPTPIPAAYITTNKSSYAKGEKIIVNFYNGPGNAKDWIGLYNNGAPDSPSLKWLYVNGTTTATIGISTGSVTFTTGLTTAGTYNARFFANDGYTRICTPVTFTVQ
jgi:hypothetical protein